MSDKQYRVRLLGGSLPDRRGTRVARGLPVMARQPALDSEVGLRVDDDERTGFAHLLRAPCWCVHFGHPNRSGDDVQFGFDPFAFLPGISSSSDSASYWSRKLVLRGGQDIHFALLVSGTRGRSRSEPVVVVQFEYVTLDAHFGPVPRSARMSPTTVSSFSPRRRCKCCVNDESGVFSVAEQVPPDKAVHSLVGGSGCVRVLSGERRRLEYGTVTMACSLPK